MAVEFDGDNAYADQLKGWEVITPTVIPEDSANGPMMHSGQLIAGILEANRLYPDADVRLVEVINVDGYSIAGHLLVKPPTKPLHPYDTGEICEPRLWHDRKFWPGGCRENEIGMVDFDDNSESRTIAAVRVVRREGQYVMEVTSWDYELVIVEVK